MNNYKNNSGWILCPSKRFPGKFYYYNVLNGESAWSFNETEKKLFKIDDKTHVSQKTHRYPEPASPPDKSSYIFTKYHSASAQTFGHATFPKYISSYNIKWTPTPAPINSKKPIIRNINTKTYLPERDILVESSKEPLSQRFLKYQLSKNKTKNVFFTKVCEPTKDNIDDRTDNLWSGVNLRKSILKSFNQPEILSTKRKYIENSALIKNSVENENTLTRNYTENSNKDGKVENETIKKGISTTEKNQENLDKNDLRYILQAKRSKLDSNKTDVDLPPTVKKKKVAFNIEHSEQDLANKIQQGNVARELKRILPGLRRGIRIFSSVPFDIISKIIVTKTVNENNQILDSENDKNVDVREKYDFENIKVTAKNETHINLFLQSAEEFRPFFLDDKDRLLHANLKDTTKYNEENSYTVLSRDQMKRKFFLDSRYRENSFDQIVTDDDHTDMSDIIKNITDKLQIKKSIHTGILNTDDRIKSRSAQNPFRCLSSKTKTTDISLSTHKRNKSGITIRRVTNTKTNNEPFKNIKNNHSQLTENKNVLGDKFSCFDSQKTNPYSNQPKVSNFYSKNQSNFWQNYTSNVLESNKRTETAHGLKKICDKDEIERNEYSVEDKLRRFFTRNKIMKECVILRMDELICCFTQIMEDFIYNTIKTSSCPPPYSFCEVLLYLREVCSHCTRVVEALDNIIELNIFCPKTGYIQHNIQPKEIMKAIGCGLVLVDAFKEFQDSEVRDTENALLQLLEDIEEPKFLDLPEPLVSVIRDYTDSDRRQNFIKSRSDILLYLQKHFPEWKSYDEPPENYDLADINLHKIDDNKVVFRTSGKNLHLFKINSKNQLKIDDAHKKIDEQKGDEVKIARRFKTIDKFEKRVNESNSKENSIIHVDNESEDVCHLKIKKNANANNVKLIAEISKENCKNGKEICKRTNDSWNNHPRYLDSLSMTICEITYLSEDIHNELHKIHNVNPVSKDNSETKNVKKNKVNEDNNNSHSNIKSEKFEINDLIDDESNSNFLKIDETKDISDNGSQKCYELLKHFLIKLSATLQLIYSFIKESVHRLRKEDVKEDYKKVLHEETSNTYIYLKDIIENLNSIIERETKDENALRILVINADVALSDKRVTRYKQVVSKCLEQARLMENSLKILMNLTDDNCSLSVSSDLFNTTYINIFE